MWNIYSHSYDIESNDDKEQCYIVRLRGLLSILSIIVLNEADVHKASKLIKSAF